MTSYNSLNNPEQRICLTWCRKKVRIQEIVEQENSDDEGAHSDGHLAIDEDEVRRKLKLIKDKGFSLKFNPHTKWSRSLYKCLDKLQRDGKHILLLNREDQAGFWLDSTFTHKSTPSLDVNGSTVTTHTDFLNKHQTQLQTMSYNFTRTATTSEVCVGVVKASGVHKKNPAQHAVDLEMLQTMNALKPVFCQETGEVKAIGCSCWRCFWRGTKPCRSPISLDGETLRTPYQGNSSNN